MGAVFVGEHVHMQKRVAIKVLRPEVEGFATMAARFEREAIAGARVDHPNVAAATDFGRTEDGSYFLVLEYVPGKTLRQVIKAGAVPPARAAHLARQIAAGLDACHRAGVLHRDVKPRNIIVDEARGDLVKLIDFGLARVPTVVEPDETDGEEAADGDEAPTHRHLTIKGIVFGTVAYMAPEAALGMEAVDERSDLYALGMILYEMLAGRHAFDATEPAELFLSQRVTIPPPLCERAPEVPVPPALEAVALRLLAKRPADRYPTAAAVVEALDAAACTDGVTAGATRSGSINLSVPPPRPRIDPGMPSETTPLEGSYSITAARLSSVPPEPDGASRPPGAPADAAPAAPASAGDDGDLRRAAARFRAGRRRALWIAGAVAAFAAVAAAAPAASRVAARTGVTRAAASARPMGPSVLAIAREAGRREQARGAALAHRQRLLEARERNDQPRGISALLALADSDPAAFEEAGVAAAAAEVTLRAEFDRDPRADALFEALSTHLGTGGLDVLYRMMSTRGGSRGADRAAALLGRPEIRARATPTLRLALELRETRCTKKKELFERAGAEGDERAAVYLEILRHPRCSKLRGECCYKDDDGLDRAIDAIRARQR